MCTRHYVIALQTHEWSSRVCWRAHKRSRFPQPWRCNGPLGCRVENMLREESELAVSCCVVGWVGIWRARDARFGCWRSSAIGPIDRFYIMESWICEVFLSYIRWYLRCKVLTRFFDLLILIIYLVLLPSHTQNPFETDVSRHPVPHWTSRMWQRNQACNSCEIDKCLGMIYSWKWGHLLECAKVRLLLSLVVSSV